MDQSFQRGEGFQGQSYQQQEQQIAMPKRPKIEYDQQSRPIYLSTNYLKIDLKKNIEEIYLLRIDFNPTFEADNRVLRDKLISYSKSQLKEYLGNHYLINAQQIFSVEKPNFNRETTFKTTFQKNEYQVILKITKVFRLDDLNSDNKKKSQFPLVFFHVMGKNMLRNLNFFEFGKNTKYFEPSAEYHQKIQGTNLIVYKGWNTPFDNCKDGIMMKLDLIHKVARSENALNYVNLIYKNNEVLGKDDKRRIVQKKLVDQTFMANYGNFKQFKIYDIIFDKNCKEIKLSDLINDSQSDKPGEAGQQAPNQQQKTQANQDLTLYDYYLKKYGLKIKYEKQPLFLVYEKKLKKYLYFIPELCVLTGIPDDINDFQKRELSNITKSKPIDLYNMVTQFIDRLIKANPTEDNLSASHIAEALNINFEKKPYVVKAKQIAYPTITFGSSRKDAPREIIDDRSCTQFQMRYPIYNSSSYLSIALIHFSDFRSNDLIQNWLKIQKDLRIDIKKPVEFNLGDFNHKAMQEIEKVILREIKKDKFDIVTIVAPNKFSTQQNYAKIKKLCTLQQQIKSQYIRQSSLENKNSYVVSAATLAQMAAKCGSTLWVANPPNGIPINTMIIGVSVQKVFIDGVSQFVVGFVASQDKIISRFYSRATFQQQNKDNIQKIGTFIVDSVKQYFIQNKFVPENIIYLRENINDEAIQTYLATEVKEILQSFVLLSPQYKPKLCVILLECRHGVKCFQKVGEGYKAEQQNPPSGSIIDNQITSKNHYDFYMISQNVRSGTATPVHYKVIYDTTGFPEGRLQDLLYSQCFNYVNWSGAIKYPAQIQYARRLAKMLGTFIQEEFSEKFYNFQFYI